MGEIADMMLDGVLCQECGEYLGEGDGYPTFCADCIKHHPELLEDDEEDSPRPKTPCPKCGRKVFGIKDHLRDKHGIR